MTKKGSKQKFEKEPVEKDKKTSVDADDEEVNSGFGSYLRSSTGQEVLRLFVIVNSLVMFLTLAWPQMKNVFEIISEYFAENFGSNSITVQPKHPNAMLGLMIRGFFILGIMSWYSAGVWKFIDSYFREEYKKYLTEEFKRNKHIQLDSETSTQLPPSEDIENFPADNMITSNILENHENDDMKTDTQTHHHCGLPPSYPTSSLRLAGDFKELPLDDTKSFINTQKMETCVNDLCHSQKQLDYHNNLRANDLQSQEDDAFVRYWLEPRSTDNSDNNLHCQPREANCEDN